MKWEVQIDGDMTDLKELSKSLKDSLLRIIAKGDQYFLESTKFNELETHKEVTSVVNEILILLRGSAKLALGGRVPIKLAGIARIREDGGRDIFAAVSNTIHLSASVGLTIKRSDGTVEVFNPADKVPEWVKLGLTDLTVTKALRLFGAKEQHDWVSLYRLYEVIEEDIGGGEKIASKKWATKTSVKLFKHTACSVSAVGDAARHGKESTSPPKNPMNLAEARSLIEGLLHSWLRSKL